MFKINEKSSLTDILLTQSHGSARVF